MCEEIEVKSPTDISGVKNGPGGQGGQLPSYFFGEP